MQLEYFEQVLAEAKVDVKVKGGMASKLYPEDVAKLVELAANIHRFMLIVGLENNYNNWLSQLKTLGVNNFKNNFPSIYADFEKAVKKELNRNLKEDLLIK